MGGWEFPSKLPMQVREIRFRFVRAALIFTDCALGELPGSLMIRRSRFQISISAPFAIGIAFSMASL